MVQRILDELARDGFVRSGEILTRDQDGVIQVVQVTETLLEAFQIEVGIFVKAVSRARPKVAFDCHLYGAVGAIDGTMHEPGTQFPKHLIEALNDADFSAWCTHIYDTCIDHIFRVLSSDLQCARLAKNGAAVRMHLAVMKPYRTYLKMPENTGQWEWREGEGEPPIPPSLGSR